MTQNTHTLLLYQCVKCYCVIQAEDNRNNLYKGFGEEHSVFRGQGIKLNDLKVEPKNQDQTFNILKENIRISLLEKYKDCPTLMQGTWNPSESHAIR